ncbi:hypothetical protein [Pedobacter sp. KLB.chiD]|uniref:hypothetical protein n=1 Tax=Pedobacter sp. KLB.chiD TaxID=3387402 RepID=UPI00399A0436
MNVSHQLNNNKEWVFMDILNGRNHVIIDWSVVTQTRAYNFREFCVSVAKKNIFIGLHYWQRKLIVAGFSVDARNRGQILSVKLNLQIQMLSILYLYRYEIHVIQPFSGPAIYFLYQKRSC